LLNSNVTCNKNVTQQLHWLRNGLRESSRRRLNSSRIIVEGSALSKQKENKGKVKRRKDGKRKHGETEVSLLKNPENWKERASR